MSSPITNTASFIRSKTGFTPDVGIILGTGLGALAEKIQVEASLDYTDIPGFPVSTVEGHAGRLIFGTLGGRRVVAMQGRFHYYEGYSPEQIVFPVRVMKALGIRTLIVSNASGGVNPTFRTGDVMVITDHISLLPNPLIGPNDPSLGPRFPDMSEPYSRRLIALADSVAEKQGVGLQHGCYLSNSGPTFETQKEYAFYRTIGADTVGMSTTPEVIAARHMGLPVLGLSIITNLGLGAPEVTHEEVQREGARAQQTLTALVEGVLSEPAFFE